MEKSTMSIRKRKTEFTYPFDQARAKILIFIHFQQKISVKIENFASRFPDISHENNLRKQVVSCRLLHLLRKKTEATKNLFIWVIIILYR